MRVIIGIILGFIIVFNWAAITEFFNGSLSDSATKIESKQDSRKNEKPESKQKQDLFKEFK